MGKKQTATEQKKFIFKDAKNTRIPKTLTEVTNEMFSDIH